jgi:hypothetical protein
VSEKKIGEMAADVSYRVRPDAAGENWRQRLLAALQVDAAPQRMTYEEFLAWLMKTPWPNGSMER